jgi:hypothetical protein
MIITQKSLLMIGTLDARLLGWDYVGSRLQTPQQGISRSAEHSLLWSCGPNGGLLHLVGLDHHDNVVGLEGVCLGLKFLMLLRVVNHDDTLLIGYTLISVVASVSIAGTTAYSRSAGFANQTDCRGHSHWVA